MNRILLAAFAFTFSIFALAAEEKSQQIVIYKDRAVDSQIVPLLKESSVVKVFLKEIEVDQDGQNALVNVGALFTKILKESHEEKIKTRIYDDNLFASLTSSIEGLNQSATALGIDKRLKKNNEDLTAFYNKVVDHFTSLLAILESLESDQEDERRARELLNHDATLIENAKKQIPLPEKIVGSFKHPQAALLLIKGYDLVLFLAQNAAKKEFLFGKVSNLSPMPLGFKDPSNQKTIWQKLHRLVSFGNLKLVNPHLQQCESLRQVYKNLKKDAMVDTHTDKCSGMDEINKDYCHALLSQRFAIVNSCFEDVSSSAKLPLTIDVK